MNRQFNKIKNLLTYHQEQLSLLGGNHIAIFGSLARDEATEDSDVDLVTRRALHPALKKRILGEAKEIF